MYPYDNDDPIEEAKIVGRSEGVNATVSRIANALGIQIPWGLTPTERRDYLIARLADR